MMAEQDGGRGAKADKVIAVLRPGIRTLGAIVADAECKRLGTPIGS